MSSFDSSCLGEQPVTDVVRHCDEPLVADALAVEDRHVVAGAAHDVIDCNLVSRLARDRFEGVPEGVETNVPTVDA